MFSFLNPTILLAATAALIPLIIHLFSRRRRKVVEFSSLRHLKSMQRRQVRRLKIRQLLLLIIRMLIILMVVLAFARPTSKEGGLGSHASVSAVILVDNSASMDRSVRDGTLFEIARKRTGELLETFTQSDQVSLMPLVTGSDRSPAEFSSAAVAIERLEKMGVASGSADLQSGVERAVDFLSSASNLNREIYLVTDRQRQSLPDEGVLNDTDVEVYIVDLPLESVENRGIVSVGFGGQLILPGHDFDIAATVRNYGPETSGDLIASCFLDGRRVAQTDFEVPGGGETTVRFSQSVSRTGFHSGYIEISDDMFLADNRYYFSLGIPERFNLLLIDGDEATRFFALSLAPTIDGLRYWSVKEATPQALTGVDINDYDVIMLAGAPSLNSSYFARIRNFVRRGKSLFISYGGNTDIDDFNSTWSTISGVTFEEPVRVDFNRAGYYALQSVEINHPIFNVFDFEDNQPPLIKFYTVPKVRVSPDVRVLMHFTGNRPALVEFRYGSGTVLTFTGPVAPYYSDLISHGFFVPLISRIAEYLASDLSSLDTRLFADMNITRSLSSTGSVTDPVSLVTPDSSDFFIAPEEEQGALVVKARPTDKAGIYRIHYHGREVDRFAVNVNPAECDLAQVDQDQFATALGLSEYRPLGVDADVAAEISAFRIGRELWQVFLWIAVILLAAEMILGRMSPSEE